MKKHTQSHIAAIVFGLALLSTRTAEKIFTRYFGGRPWVDRESPISSIDPSVTRALVECGQAGH